MGNAVIYTSHAIELLLAYYYWSTALSFPVRAYKYEQALAIITCLNVDQIVHSLLPPELPLKSARTNPTALEVAQRG